MNILMNRSMMFDEMSVCRSEWLLRDDLILLCIDIVSFLLGFIFESDEKWMIL